MQHLRIFALLILAVSSVKSYSINQRNGQINTVNGDVEIIINSTTWKCDRIFCPKDTTDRCVVIKRNLPDNQRIVRRENYCYSADNKILAQTADNQDVGENVFVSSETIVHRDGSVVSNNSGNNFSSNIDPELEKEINETMQKLQKDLQENTNRIHQQMENMQKDLQNSLSNMFNWG